MARCTSCDGTGRGPGGSLVERGPYLVQNVCHGCGGYGTVAEPVEAREMEVRDDAVFTAGRRAPWMPKQ